MLILRERLRLDTLLFLDWNFVYIILYLNGEKIYYLLSMIVKLKNKELAGGEVDEWSMLFKLIIHNIIYLEFINKK